MEANAIHRKMAATVPTAGPASSVTKRALKHILVETVPLFVNAKTELAVIL